MSYYSEDNLKIELKKTLEFKEENLTNDENYSDDKIFENDPYQHLQFDFWKTFDFSKMIGNVFEANICCYGDLIMGAELEISKKNILDLDILYDDIKKSSIKCDIGGFQSCINIIPNIHLCDKIKKHVKETQDKIIIPIFFIYNLINANIYGYEGIPIFLLIYVRFYVQIVSDKNLFTNDVKLRISYKKICVKDKINGLNNKKVHIFPSFYTDYISQERELIRKITNPCAVFINCRNENDNEYIFSVTCDNDIHHYNVLCGDVEEKYIFGQRYIIIELQKISIYNLMNNEISNLTKIDNLSVHCNKAIKNIIVLGVSKCFITNGCFYHYDNKHDI
ncbi:hypothetical protein Catovirus_1_730 [Catovirus CTV1]|uniref:Uncharacterized protein n=1 Tax=Catovirus CTV1 TaxID=1977631 RepID=A0A1V0SAD3_9VIRU|nr:hypothetical protein Catovirus_1_730 [Catovirus CTV1]